MQRVVAGLALQGQQDEGPVLLGSKRNRQEVPAAAVRIRVWHKFGDSILELQAVPERLLSAHATSVATELNWSLWGRMHCAARSSFGMQRAKALIAICAAEKAKCDPTQECELTLSVLEGGESDGGFERVGAGAEGANASLPSLHTPFTPRPSFKKLFGPFVFTFNSMAFE
jgi:hypothetical protein